MSDQRKEQIKDNLLKEGQEGGKTTEVFESSQEGLSSSQLNSGSRLQLEKAKRFLKQPKKIVIPIIGAVLICAVIFAGWWLFFRDTGIIAQFELTASLEDSAGVDPKTSFTLKSSKDLSVKTIKKIVKFNPEVDFGVKKLNNNILGSIIDIVSAKEKLADNQSSFKITPKTSLKSDNIYRVSINDEEFVDREYSWAYQIKASFQVVSTHPRNKGTSVPVNSGIEITFNREGLINPEKYFSIVPKVEGNFEVMGNILIFKPKGFDSYTVYSVTIKKGLSISGSDEILSEDYVFNFETGYKGSIKSQSYLTFENDFLEFIPGDKPTFQIYYGSLDVKNLEFNIYKFANVDNFVNSYQNSRQWILGWTYYYRRNVGSLYEPVNEPKILSFKPEIIIDGSKKFLQIPQSLEQGYYLVDVDIGGKRRQAWLQITPLSHYSSVTNEQSLLWVNDFEKKTPVNDVQISYIGSSNSVGIGRTNNEGLIQFSTPDDLKDKGDEDVDVINPKFFKMEHSEYPTTIIKIMDSWGYYRGVREGDQYWDHLATDRYTYKMNDDLRYWGVVKGRNNDLRQKKVTVGLYRGYYLMSWDGTVNKPLVVQEAVVSSFDTIQGKIQFKGVDPGFYNVIVSIDDEVISQAPVQIFAYTKPAYQITITSSKQAIFTGQRVDFKVKASFFDDTPVPNLKLTYSGYWFGSIKGELELDRFGEGTFSYAPTYKDRQYWPRTFRIRFDSKMAEEGDIYGSSSILVFGPGINLQSFQKKESGDTYKFTAKLNDIVLDNRDLDSGGYVSRSEYIGNPTKNYLVSADIVRIIYHKIPNGTYYDYIDKVVREKYRYKREEHFIEKVSGLTDKNGEWNFTRDLPKVEDGFYRVDFSSKDDYNKIARNSRHVNDYSISSSWKKFRTALTINNKNYEELSEGEEINLELKIVEGEKPDNAKVLFYGFQNNINEAEVVSSLSYKDKFRESFIPSMRYRAVILGPYGFEESNIVVAEFKKEDNKLSVTISPDKEEYRPGDEVKLDLKIEDKDKKGVSSEVNVAIIDEALFHILPYEYSSDILDDIYEDIWERPLTQISQYNLLDDSPSSEMGGCFIGGTKILMVDGSYKNIENVRIGDQILTRKDEFKEELAIATVQGVSEHLVNEYLIINNFLEVTPEHRLYVNGKWIYAGHIKEGDQLINQKGELIQVDSIKLKQKSVLVYNIIVNKYHTYFADGLYVHNEEKGGQARSNFVDVAFYDTVQTDGSGRALISYTSPDNITAWRVTVKAFATDGLKAGENFELIKTSLPFFVDATLNEFYLIGDSPLLRIRAFGDNLNQAADVRFGVESESLGISENKASPNNVIYVSLGNLTEGEHELTIFAEQGEYRDSIIRKIKVVKSYFKKGESSFYKLSNDLSNIESNKDGFTRIKFMDLNRGRLYQSLWGNKYGSSVRADQKTASYMANKLLSDYFEESWQEEDLGLSQYYMESGAIGLFAYGDEDLALSAKLSDLVPEFIFQNRLKDYFRSSLSDGKADIHRISKALYGLANLNELVLTKINSVKENTMLNLEDKTYLALALVKLGDKEGARKIYFNEVRSSLRFQGQEAWVEQESDITKRIKLTGLIAVLASYVGVEDSYVLGEYILSHNPEKDLDVIEELLYIKSELARSKDSEAKFKYETNARSESITLEKGKSYELVLSSEELQSIKFNNIKGDISLVSFYEKSKDPKELAKNSELSLTRTYLVNGQPTNLLREGEVVMIRLDPKINQSAIDGGYQIIDYLPSGLKPVTQMYRVGFDEKTHCNPIWYTSMTQDNTVYFNIWKGFNKVSGCTNRTINYYARVVSKGDYKANPAIIQSLKDLESLNLSPEHQVKIK